MMTKLLTLLALTALGAEAIAHGSVPAVGTGERTIRFPDIDERLTLVVDLHTHSVFSDGHVWPSIRVQEAALDGLDGLAITEHLEYQPHRADIPHTDRNRAYQEAVASAGATDVLIIPGAEITRDKPAGHINAVFIEDANALLRIPEDASLDPSEFYRQTNEWPAAEALRSAAAQSAFVFWNHPYWTAQRPDGIAQLSQFHRDMISADLIQGIEIANGNTYSEESHRIGLEQNLTLIGVSDVHNLIDWDYPPADAAHRPVTLVFAAERSAAAIKAALQARQTVVWFKDLLIGRKPQLDALLEAIVSAKLVGWWRNETRVVEVELKNDSSATLQLTNTSEHTFMTRSDQIVLPPHSTTTLLVKTGGQAVQLAFAVDNALIAPKQPATLTFQLPLPDTP